jgi:hypothetical protein
MVGTLFGKGKGMEKYFFFSFGWKFKYERMEWNTHSSIFSPNPKFSFPQNWE